MLTKGIILAGGAGSRLFPLTAVVSKQLQPIYDKPMIYYPLTTLVLAGVRELLLISTPTDVPRFEALLGDGSQWGLELRYTVQPRPEGIAQALVIASDVGFLDGAQRVMLLLGDNLIYGRLDFMRAALEQNGDGATIFAHQVSDPSAYGVVEFDASFRVLSLEEKPARPRSSWAVPGMYIYGADVAERARALRPSPRGELEITDLNRAYLADGKLLGRPMGRGIAWFDTGTPSDLLAASSFVHALQTRQGLIIGSPEESAYRQGFLDLDGLAAAIAALPRCTYRSYLERLELEERAQVADGRLWSAPASPKP